MAWDVLRVSCDFSGISWGASGLSRALSGYLADVSGISRWYVVDIAWLSEEMRGNLGISRDISGISRECQLHPTHISFVFHSYLGGKKGHLEAMSGYLGLSLDCCGAFHSQLKISRGHILGSFGNISGLSRETLEYLESSLDFSA